MTDPLGKTEIYEYDSNDNLIRMTDRKGQVTTYSYDNKNRPQRTDYADGGYTENTYDAVGRLISISDSASGPIKYLYSDTGCSTCGGVPDKVIQETTPLGTISYSYDALGRRTCMTVVGQPAVNYQYDSDSQLLNISTLNSPLGTLNFNFTYDALNRQTSLTYPNGVTTNYTYDNSSRLLNLQHLNPLNQILESLSYTYDENGSRTMMNRANIPVKLPDPKSNAIFDSANRMLSFNDKSFAYDDNGNMTTVTSTCGATAYTWDARNRLVAIIGFTSNCQPISANFRYDVLGRRIQKTINGRTIQYVYDGIDIVQEIENGAISTNYLRTVDIDEPLARLTPNAMRFYQTDALGSVVALTDETGSIRTQYIYDPFGNVTITGESNDNSFQYTGRENDGTGLYYYRVRYYSPELERFVSEDPVGLKGGIGFYVYVANSPTGKIDPSGMFTYNTPDTTITGRLTGEALDLANCMEKCIGTSFVVSGGSECYDPKLGKHTSTSTATNSAHCTNQAFDMKPTGMDKKKVFCCALECNAKYAQDEGNHFHFDTLGGEKNAKGERSRGELPKKEDCECGKK
jgi:RHS repeat-associated protein